MAAGNVLTLVLSANLLLIVFLVSAAGRQDDESSLLASRTLLSAAVFDGRVVAPLSPGPGGAEDGRLLFRVRRVYKGWHHASEVDQPRMTRLDHSSDRRLVYVSCRYDASSIL